MARRRYLSTTVSTDSAVNKLAQESDFAALLYSWLIPHAEDDGLVPSGDPDEILAMVVPMRRDKTAVDISDALALMEKLELIVWHDDCVEFDPDSFYEYQSYVKADRRRTTPYICVCPRHSTQDAEVPRNSTQNTASFNPSPSHSPSHSPSPPTPQPAAKNTTMMRDPLWRALVEVFGDPTGRRSEFDETWRFLTSVDATPEMVVERTGKLVSRWSDGKKEPVVFKPTTLIKHWGSFDGAIGKVSVRDVEKAHDDARRQSLNDELELAQEEWERTQRKAIGQ